MKKLFTVLLTMVVGLALAQNDTWTAREDFDGGARFLGTSFSIGTKLFAGTGLDATAVPFDDFWEYDVSLNSWTQKGSFDGGPRLGSVGFAINGKGYVVMGTNFITAFKDVWEYTPATDTWVKKADFPGTGRAGAFVFIVDNKAYIGAGQDATGTPLNDVWEYNPATDSWLQKASFPSTPRLYPAAFAIGTKGYMGTGLSQEDGSLADFWEYNTANNQWTRKADHPQPTAGAIAFATSTRGYMGLGNTVDLYSYYPNENVWVQEADYPAGSSYVNASCAVSGGKAYVGLGGVSASVAFYAYIPATDQSITFNPLTSRTFGDGPFGLGATATSGLTVSFSSSNASVATISGVTVTIVGAGTTTITATQAGNGTYDAALPVERILTVNKANQSIMFSALTGKNVGDAAFDLTATASSSLAVSYVSSNTSVATISGATVTIVGAGTATITASQAGNTNYNAATSVDRDLVVSKLGQSITFGALPSKSPGNPPFNLAATASSGLAVTYVSTNTSVATISGSTVTIIDGGTTTITASQAGNAMYNAATSVDRDLVVVKTAQTWMGSLPATAAYGTDIAPVLQLSSGLPYTLTSSDQNVATVTLSEANWTIRPKGVGTTTLTASHAGNASFEAAPTLTASLVISKGTQTISFVEFSGGTYTVVTASASSGLIVTFDPPDDPLGQIVITGNIATVFGAFSGTLTARHPGNDAYEEVEADWTKVIGKLNAPLSMDPIPEKAVGDDPFMPHVEALAVGVPYSFSSTNPAVAQIVAGQVVILNKGTTNIFAINPGDFSYNPSSTFRELVVKSAHDLEFPEIPVKTFGDAPFTVQATSIVGLPVTYSSSDPSIATVSGNTVTIRGVGSAWIVASAGDITFARRNVSRVLTVKSGPQTPAQQGQFWGVATNGGSVRAGAIYKTNSDGTGLTVVKEFKGGADEGTHPGSSTVVASNGKIYGWTGDGALHNEGAFFEYDPLTSTITKKYEFDFADYCVKNLVATPNGKIYGSKTGTLDGEPGSVVFEFDIVTGTFTKKKSLSGFINWVSDVFAASNGKIYVSGSYGNQLELRAFVEYDPVANTLTKKAEVAWSTTGAYSTGPVEHNGKFYGTTQGGGINNEGFVYEFDPVAGTATEKASFTKANFNFTYAQGLMKASNGRLYGCASWGGPNKNGYVFEFDPIQNTITSIADFPAFAGGTPTGQMIEAPNGRLYGTDNSGNMGGGIFEFNPATGQLLTQIIFNDNTGKAMPGNFGLLGNKLYGFGSRGGANNGGTVFEYDYAARTVVKKYDFGSATEGYSPMIGLTAASNSKLYGINRFGGVNDEGVLFEYDPATDVYKKMLDFNGNTIGNNPQTPLLAGLNGKLYGCTRSGVKFNNSSGTIFEFDPATGAYQSIAIFGYNTGTSITHQLAQSAKTGKLYGLHAVGGANGSGVLFEVDPATKTYRKLVEFSTDKGTNPNMAPMIASNGKVYGVTPSGGASNVGVLFEYDLATSTYAVKHNFEAATGAIPYSILTEVDGILWGTATVGGNGTANKGVIFQYDPSTGTYTKKYDFGNIGSNPGGKILYAADNKLYLQTTYGGGIYGGQGLLCEYDITTNTLIKKSELPSDQTFGGATINFLVQTTKSFRDDQTITIEPVGTKVLGQATFTPVATATSGLPVVFSAGNNAITVGSDGKVTMIAAGKAILKANQAGNSDYNPAPEAQAMFCVNPAKPTVTSVMNTSGTLTLTSSNTTGNQWYADGTEIPTAVNKTLEVTTPGAYTVKTVVDDCASEMSSPFPVVVTGDIGTTGTSFSLYPNPAEDKLYITLPGNNRKRVTLLQADGRVAGEHETSSAQLEIDVRSYSAGLYLVRVSDEKGSYPAMKFLKK